MLRGLRGTIGRTCGPHVKSTGSRFMAVNRTPFVSDQNEDGFMVVGRGVQPSSLRRVIRVKYVRSPNLKERPSTTSDENWAQILRDVDPPSHHIVHSGGRMRASTLSPRFRTHHATQSELQAMNNVFKQVFSMEAASDTQPNTKFFANMIPALSTGRTLRQSGRSQDLELIFDGKREAIQNCRTDLELLRWAIAEVFQEPLQPRAGADDGGTIPKTTFSESAQPIESTQPIESIQLTDASQTTKPARKNRAAPIHPGIYARVIALLMVEFREKYQNPHLAIAIFDHTRRRSIMSFVTGCTAPSYTELMRCYWDSFHDLQTVFSIAEEMRVNGVNPDDRTHRLYFQIEREAWGRVAWVEGGEEELSKLLSQLEPLMKPRTQPKSILS